MADLLAVLYNGVLRVDPKQPDSPERDRFILSKGHACAALYVALANRDFFRIHGSTTFTRTGRGSPGARPMSEFPGRGLDRFAGPWATYWLRHGLGGKAR